MKEENFMPATVLEKMDICDEAEAEILATNVHQRVQLCYSNNDAIAMFRVINPPPKHDVLKKFRDILIEDFGYEDVEWYYHDDFMWDIIVYRKNLHLL